MKILHIGDQCGFGGAETVIVSLVREQKKLGAEVDVFFYSDFGGAVQFEDLCNVQFHNNISLLEVLVRNRYDIIHIIGAATQKAKRNIERLAYNGSLIITNHGCCLDTLNSDYVTAVSKFAATEIQDICNKPIHVIYNGIDTNQFSPCKRELASQPLVAWVARSMDIQKDYAGLTALAASGLLKEFKIVVVDGSSDEQEIGNWLPDGSEIICQLPWKEMPNFYRRVASSGGFLLSTSRVERCPMNILEAQACGCPVIAPIVGGIPEIVQHKTTGYLYDKKDGLTGLKNAIDWLYDGKNWDKASAAAASYIACEFTAEKMCKQYMDLYEEAIAARKHNVYSDIKRWLIFAGMPATRLYRKALWHH